MFSKTIIIGRLGHSPSKKDTKTGTPMCTFSVAVDSGYGDRKVTDWFSVSAFGKQAENCLQYLGKGSLVNVTGTVHLREYDGRDGKRHASLELSADSVVFLSRADAQAQPDAQSPSQAQSAQAQPQDTFGGELFDDECPF